MKPSERIKPDGYYDAGESEEQGKKGDARQERLHDRVVVEVWLPK